MAKKKKKKKISPEDKFKRRMKKYFRRIFYIALIIAAYFWLLPIIMPSYTPQVDKSKEQLIQAANLANQEISKFLGVAIGITGELTETSKKMEEEGGAEAYIQKAVDDFKEKVKTLPREQVQKAKREFCADVIEEEGIVFEASESVNIE